MISNRFSWVGVGTLALVALALALAAGAEAQWTSPGTGQTYDLASLEADSGGEIGFDAPPCDWVVQGVITISDTDTLNVAPGCTLAFDPGAGFVIEGRLNVSGTAAFPVLFRSIRGSPAAGDWAGVEFRGAAFAPSYLDNLTLNHSTVGIRCAGCSGGLYIANVAVNSNSGDALLVTQAGRNIQVLGLSLSLPTPSATQSVVGIGNGSNITGGALTGTNVAVVLVSWNASNISFAGPLTGTGIGRYLLWVDNSTFVWLSGGSAAGANASVLVTRSANVTLSNLTLAGTVRTAVDVRETGPIWISNATLSTTAVPLSINQSSAATVNDTSLSGGSPATAFVIGSSNVTMRNVNATGGVQGLLVQASPNFALLGGNVTGATLDGVRIIGSANFTVDGTRILGNTGRGLWISGSSDATVRNAAITGNTREGVFASATTFRLIDSAVYLNTLDGVVATNGSAMNATNLQSFSNGREGIWLIGGTHLLAGATLRANGANGTRIEGGTLAMTDGAVENNTLFGVFFALNATGSWTARAVALLASDAAVLAGGLTADGGQFNGFNANITVRGSPFIFAASNGGRLWLDDVGVSAAASSTYGFNVTAGSSFGAFKVRLDAPGAPPTAAVRAQDGAVDWIGVDVSAALAPIILVNSTGIWDDVSIEDAVGNAVELSLGSQLTATRLKLETTGEVPLLLWQAVVSLHESWILNTTDFAAIDAQFSAVDLTDVVIQGGNTGVSLAVAAQLTFSNLTIGGVGRGLAVSSSTATGDGLFVSTTGSYGAGVWLLAGTADISNATFVGQFNDAGIDATASSFNGQFVSSTGARYGILSDASDVDIVSFGATASESAVFLVNRANLSLRSAVLHSTLAAAVNASGAGTVRLEDSQLVSDSGSALRGVLGGNFTFMNVTLEAPVWTAVVIDGADSLAIDGAVYDRCGAGILVLNVPEVSIANANGDCPGNALEIQNVGNLTLSGGVFLSGASVGLTVANVGTFSGADVSASGAPTGGSIARVTTLSLMRFNFTAASGPALVLDAAPSAVLSLGELTGTTASTITASAGARLDNLTFWAHALIVDASSGLRLADLEVFEGTVSISNSTGVGVDGLHIHAPASSTALSLGANGSAVLRRLDISGGAYAVLGLGGPYLEVHESSFDSQTTTALMARSYASVVMDGVSSTGAPTGLDLRYIPSLSARALVVTGSTLNGVIIDRSNNASLTGATLALANGTGLRLFGSAFAVIDGVDVAGGRLGFDLNGSTGARISNATVQGALRGLAATNASSAVVDTSSFTGGTTVGVVAYSNSSVDVWNSLIAGAVGFPAFHAAEATSSGLLRLYDTTADNATFSRASLGTIEVYWSLTVFVRSGASGQSGVAVALRDRAGASVGSVTSNASGFSAFGYRLELRDSQAGRLYASPYDATATLGTGYNGVVAFDLNAPTLVTLDLLDTQPPTLEQRPTPRVRLGGTYTFRVDPGDRDNVAIVRYTWSFSDGSGTPQLAESTLGPGFVASHTYTVSGLWGGVVTAYDAAGNSFSRPFNVSVNAPPYFLHLPPESSFIALVGVPLELDFTASDNDTADVAALAYAVTGSPEATILGGFLYITPSAARDLSLTVSVTDGLDTTSYSFMLRVGTQVAGPNAPPEFTSEAKLNATVTLDYVYPVTVLDPESDPVVIQLLEGPEGMTFTQVIGQPTGQLFWRPSNYYERTVLNLSVNISISLRAWDGKGANFAYQNFTLVLKNPADQPPVMLHFDDFVMAPGEVRTLNLSLYASDPDDASSTLIWSIVKPGSTEGATIGFDTEDPNILVIRAPDTIEGTKSFTVQFVVRDSSGLSDARPVVITLSGPTVAEAAFPWLLLLIVVGGVGAAFALATRQRAAALADELATTRATPPGSAQTTIPAGDAGFPIYLEGAALFDRSDNILVSAAVDEADLDDVFVLLPAMAREIGAADGALRHGRVGGREVAFLRQGDAVLAAVGKFAGDPAAWLEDSMKSVLDQVQARGAELNVQELEALADDPGVVEAVKALLAISSGSSPEAVARYLRESALRVASVVELVQGLVRLKVAVDNNSGQIAADVRLSVEFDDKVMRLERMEPQVEVRRDKVQLGNLRPSERKTVAYYFDPQICARTFFNATVGWEDGRGAFHSTTMRTRAAEVACPAFSTPKQANTAMLKRMLQEGLAFRDSKYFRFPGQTSAEQVFESCKQAVLAQDVRLVREFVTERPYRAEAWFYGETKVKKSPTVIWTTVYGQERVAQFSVASGTHAAITGLLAELGRRLVDSRAGGGIGAPIEALRKTEATAEIGEPPTLLSKSKSAENDST